MVGVASGSANSRQSSEPIRASDSSAALNESVELGSLWQKFNKGKWIVGLNIYNTTSRLVTYLLVIANCLLFRSN